MKFDWQRLLTGPWLQNSRTDWFWDEQLNKALDIYGVKPVDAYHAQVGPLTVWVSNWPYAYGKIQSPTKSDALPSKATRKRLRRMLHEEAMTKITEALGE